ncbi:Catalase-peroxidase [Bienertia sinuspersici]
MEIDQSIRVNVVVDMEQPLREVVTLKLRGGESVKVNVKYERLPIFFFACGRLWHGEKDCEENNGDHSPVKRYGNHLKASPWKMTKQKSGNNEHQEHSIAKCLFVVQPQRSKKDDEKKQVQGVVDKLEAFQLEGMKEGSLG